MLYHSVILIAQDLTLTSVFNDEAFLQDKGIDPHSSRGDM